VSQSPPRQAAAPLGTTRTSGTLPFTGAELSVFALVGLALIGGGILLRMTGRQKRSRG
jgi:LPXTG-motif cell wall-anchored protein